MKISGLHYEQLNEIASSDLIVYTVFKKGYKFKHVIDNIFTLNSLVKPFEINSDFIQSLDLIQASKSEFKSLAEILNAQEKTFLNHEAVIISSKIYPLCNYINEAKLNSVVKSIEPVSNNVCEWFISRFYYKIRLKLSSDWLFQIRAGHARGLPFSISLIYKVEDFSYEYRILRKDKADVAYQVARLTNIYEKFLNIDWNDFTSRIELKFNKEHSETILESIFKGEYEKIQNFMIE